MTGAVSKSRIVKRDLLANGGELESLIVSAAAQRPGIETNALLARLQDGAIQSEVTKAALEIIEVVGRIPDQRAITDNLLNDVGHHGDPWALEQYVTELNSLFFKFKRQHQITQYSADEFKATRCTDAANGLRFEQQFRDVAKHTNTLEWIVWDGRRHARDPKAARELAKQTPDVVRAEVKQLAEDMELQDRETADRFQECVEALIKHAKVSASTRGLDNILREAATTPGINGNALEYDADPWLLNCPNGVVDLRSGDLLFHDPKYLITKLAPTDYDPEATCPRWDQFLAEVFNGDAHLVEYVRRALAYTLTGDTSWQCWFLLHGAGENGKSRFVDVLRRVLGPDYTSEIDPEELCQQPWARHSTERAALRGVRYLTAEETEEGRQLNESFVKALTGEGRLRARFMRQDSFEFSPVCKLWLSTNNLPVVKDNSHGFWRRVRFIPFAVNFANSPTRDPHLSDKLAAEAPGILAQLVRYAGLVYLEGEGRLPAGVEAARAEYRGDSDLLGQFLEEHTTDAWPHNELPKRDLYAAYQRHTGGKCESTFRFNARIKARGVKDGHNRMGSTWIGLTLRAEADDP